LGGYKENEFEEYHYKILAVAESMELASKKPKRVLSINIVVSRSPSHIDDEYGVDIDNIYNNRYIGLPKQRTLHLKNK
jgi:hypothetical protein